MKELFRFYCICLITSIHQLYATDSNRLLTSLQHILTARRCTRGESGEYIMCKRGYPPWLKKQKSKTWVLVASKRKTNVPEKFAMLLIQNPSHTNVKYRVLKFFIRRQCLDLHISLTFSQSLCL